MKKVTLDEAGQALGWRGHSAYFNSQLFGFPEALSKNDDGEHLYDYEALVEWERNRPIKPSESLDTGIILVANLQNNVL